MSPSSARLSPVASMPVMLALCGCVTDEGKFVVALNQYETPMAILRDYIGTDGEAVMDRKIREWCEGPAHVGPSSVSDDGRVYSAPFDCSKAEEFTPAPQLSTTSDQDGAYEVYQSPDGPVATIRGGGKKAREKLTSFISSFCDGRYRIEPRISACERNCAADKMLAIAFACEAS